MPALQVKDFPDDLYEELRECAAEECRSVSQQTIYGLREFLRMRKAYQSVKNALWAAPYVTDLLEKEEEQKRLERVRKRHELLERIRERGPANIPDDFPSAAEIIREMREERTDRILEATEELELIRKLENEFDERFAALCQRAGVNRIREVEFD